MPVRLRALISAVSLAALVLPLLAAGCLLCSDGARVSSTPGSCCDPAGHCRSAPLRAAPKCLAGQTGDLAVVEQVLQLQPAAIEFFEPVLPFVLGQEVAPTPATSHWSPPPIHLLNSALLI